MRYPAIQLVDQRIADVYTCKPPLNLGHEPDSAAFTESPVPHLYSLHHSAFRPFVAELSDATILTEQALVLSRTNGHTDFILDAYHDGVLMRTIVPIAPSIGPLDSIKGEYSIEIGSTPDGHVIDGPAVLIDSAHPGNYHHWMLETLTRFWVYDKYPDLVRGLPIILLPLTRRFQHETLYRLLNGKDVDVLVHHRGFSSRFRRLIFPSFLASSGHSRRQLDWLRSKFLVHAPAPTYRRRLYISRGDAQNGRRLVNEEELWEKLAALGFTYVTASELPHAEQVDLFTDAEVILGMSGSGITNHILAPEGAHVIELHPREYTNRAHFFTSNLLGQTYQFVICDRDLVGNIVAPVERIQACIERVL